MRQDRTAQKKTPAATGANTKNPPKESGMTTVAARRQPDHLLTMSAEQRDQLADLHRAAWEAALDHRDGDTSALHAADQAFTRALYALTTQPRNVQD